MELKRLSIIMIDWTTLLHCVSLMQSAVDKQDLESFVQSLNMSVVSLPVRHVAYSYEHTHIVRMHLPYLFGNQERYFDTGNFDYFHLILFVFLVFSFVLNFLFFLRCFRGFTYHRIP